jgi:hypothetical protein
MPVVMGNRTAPASAGGGIFNMLGSLLGVAGQYMANRQNRPEVPEVDTSQQIETPQIAPQGSSPADMLMAQRRAGHFGLGPTGAGTEFSAPASQQQLDLNTFRMNPLRFNFGGM